MVEQQCEVIEFLQRRCQNLAQALLRLQTEQDRCVPGDLSVKYRNLPSLAIITRAQDLCNVSGHLCIPCTAFCCQLEARHTCRQRDLPRPLLLTHRPQICPCPEPAGTLAFCQFTHPMAPMCAGSGRLRGRCPRAPA